MKKILTLCLMLFSSSAFAQDVALELKGGNVKTVKIDRIVVLQEDRVVVTAVPFTIVAPPTAKTLHFWSFPSTVTANDRGNVLEVTAAPKGEVVVGVKCVSIKDGDFAISFGKIVFNVGDVTPPTPPVPPPPPVPPVPPPNPSPFPATGLRVLVVFETSIANGAKTAKLTPKQKVELYGEELALWLNANCAKQDGQPEYRFFDNETALTTSPQMWKDVFARPREQVPWLIVGDGIKGWEGPLPDGGILAKIKEAVGK